MRKTVFFFLSILFIFSYLESNADIDSLKARLNKVSGKEKVDILNEIAGNYWYSDPQLSIKYGIQAEEIAQKIDYAEGLAEAYHTIGGGYHISDDFQKSIEYFLKSLAIYRNLSNDLEISRCLNNLGDAHYYLSDYDKALEFFQESLSIKEKLGSRSGVSRTLHNIGKLYKDKGDYLKALEYLQKALQIREEIDDSKRIAFTLNEIGNVYNSIDSYERALEYYLRSLKIKEELSDKRGEAVTLNNIGNIHKNIGNSSKALECYKKSLKIQEEINQKSGIAYSLESIGSVYHENKDYEHALENYNKALLIRREIGDKKNYAGNLVSIGIIYEKIDMPENAFACYEKALNIQKEIEDKRGMATTFAQIGNYFYHNKSFNKSLKYYLKSIEYAKETSFNSILQNSYYYISVVYHQLDDHKKAYENFQLSSVLKDSLYNEVSSKKIAEMQIKYESEKKEKEIELLSNKQDRSRLVRNFLVLVSLLILILLILLFYLYRVKLKEIEHRKKVESEIKKLNKTLESRVREELKKREEQQTLLIQKSKLESLGRLSAGIAHEINQPVTRLSLGLDNILVRKSMNKLDDQYLEDKCNELFNDIDRIRKIIEHIRTFSRDQSSSIMEKVDVNSVIENTIQLIRTQYKNHNIELNLELEKNIGHILGNQFKLEQVILNMLSNAKDSVDEKFEKNADSKTRKSIKIKTYFRKEKINIVIEDNGLGIPADEKEKIFDPFYTTKETDKGTGLGLSISYGIIKEMEGEISVESEIGKYANMRIILPRI